MDRSGDIDDLLPDLDLAQVMRQRPIGLGSWRHVMRLTVAVTVSWLIAEAVSQSTFGLFAPVTTLLVVQSSPWTTLGLSIQRILGTGIGVLVASVWVNLVGLTWWSFLIAVAAALLVARALPWSLGGQLQIPVAVVFVLGLGAGSIQEDIWRVLDVLIGGAIGLLAVFIYPPRPRTAALEGSMAAYRDAIIATLRDIGTESGSHAAPLPPGVRHDFVGPSRRFRELAASARDDLVRYVEASRLNPRAKATEADVTREAIRLRRLGGIGLQVRGVVGEANRLYDRATIVPILDGEQLHELVDHLATLMECVLGGPGAPVGVVDPGEAARLAVALEAELRRVAESLVSSEGGVSEALGSVTLLGRLDLILKQLEEFAEWEA